ncbi:hypothetical protein LEMLEM_LOCUS19067, partial [Lemmus lemmus]
MSHLTFRLSMIRERQDCCDYAGLSCQYPAHLRDKSIHSQSLPSHEASWSLISHLPLLKMQLSASPAPLLSLSLFFLPVCLCICPFVPPTLPNLP